MKNNLTCWQCSSKFRGLSGKEDTCSKCLKKYMSKYKTLTLKTNLTKADDDDLIMAKEHLISALTASKGNSLDDTINLLLEIERELTLRENQ